MPSTVTSPITMQSFSTGCNWHSHRNPTAISRAIPHHCVTLLCVGLCVIGVGFSFVDSTVNNQDIPHRICAAQYVRMATDHQPSTKIHQEDVIREYAQARGYEIVRTYADESV